MKELDKKELESIRRRAGNYHFMINTVLEDLIDAIDNSLPRCIMEGKEKFEGYLIEMTEKNYPVDVINFYGHLYKAITDDDKYDYN